MKENHEFCGTDWRQWPCNEHAPCPVCKRANKLQDQIDELKDIWSMKKFLELNPGATINHMTWCGESMGLAISVVEKDGENWLGLVSEEGEVSKVVADGPITIGPDTIEYEYLQEGVDEPFVRTEKERSEA